jgi:hypothetical protein
MPLRHAGHAKGHGGRPRKYVEIAAPIRFLASSIQVSSRRHSGADVFQSRKDSKMTTSKRLRAIKDRRSTWARRHHQLAVAFAADLVPVCRRPIEP